MSNITKTYTPGFTQFQTQESSRLSSLAHVPGDHHPYQHPARAQESAK